MRRQAHGVITGKSDLPLPLAAEPTHAGDRPSKLRRAASPPATAAPAVAPAPAQPPPDDTVPVPMMENEVTGTDGTPPPLPPSPASAAAEVWLEDAVTRPSALSDIAPSMNLSSSSRVPVRPEMDAVSALREAHEHAVRAARKLLALSTTTAFAVGLLLGVVLVKGCG